MISLSTRRLASKRAQPMTFCDARASACCSPRGHKRVWPWTAVEEGQAAPATTSRCRPSLALSMRGSGHPWMPGGMWTPVGIGHLSPGVKLEESFEGSFFACDFVEAKAMQAISACAAGLATRVALAFLRRSGKPRIETSTEHSIRL